MKLLFKKILSLFVFEILILVVYYFLISVLNLNLKFTSGLLLSLIFTVITALVLVVFITGQKKNPESQAIHSLSAIGIKFLLELLLAFLWFFVGKKSGLPDVLLFFVLYLAFTLFSILIISKELKNRVL
ncbi:MAG TPA: hypothetical protein PLL94_00605 [Bacteroidales bacterium]|nr:hypothetical protein [Bacteroidales bacterium]HQK66616.1 hypothetical protein [Bacteroidales bacterium]